MARAAKRPHTEWIPVRVPALIDPETWERAQASSSPQSRAGPTQQHAASVSVAESAGLWALCRRMVGTWVRRAAGTSAPCATRYVPGACMGRSLSAPMVEAYVWEHVKALLSDPEVLRKQYAQGRGDPAVDVRAEQEQVRLERKLASLDREVTRLIDAYQAEVIDLTELAERRRRVEDQGRMLRERVREIEQQRTERTTELRLLEGVDAFCTSVGGPWRLSRVGF